MTQEERKRFISLLHQEVVPALGCTEPIAVALAAAKAAETLGLRPERLDVAVSANLLKNGMGVMVPGTGEMGLGVAAAAGALGGRSDLGLECLRDIDEATANDARDMLEKNAVNLHLADNDELLYCLVTASSGKENAARRVEKGEVRSARRSLYAIELHHIRDLRYDGVFLRIVRRFGDESAIRPHVIIGSEHFLAETAVHLIRRVAGHDLRF